MNGKVWWKSKILWINIVGIAIILTETLTQQKMITSEVSGLVLAVVNIVLRILTNQPIVRSNVDKNPPN